MPDAYGRAAFTSVVGARAAGRPAGVLPVPPIPAATTDAGRATAAAPYAETSTEASVADGWGRLPLFTVFAALGSLVVTLGYHGGRLEAWWADLAFWSGVLLLFLPVTCRLAVAGTPRRERIGLVSLIGLGLYLNKILHSPLEFTYHDEFAHWRTTADILRLDRLFGENPIIPVSAFYPSLHVVTAALADMSGATIYLAGVLVLAVARLLFVLGLFLFFEQAGRSARIASLATLLYMANPNFAFFDAQFAYESIALPFAMFAMYAATRQQTVTDNRFGLTLAVLLAVAAVVPAHHLTAYALVGFLVLWMTAAVYVRLAPSGWTGLTSTLSEQGGGTEKRGPSGIVLLALVISLAWLVYIAGLTVGYLTPVVWSGISELIRLIAGEVIARELFRDYSGQLAPIWERMAGFSSVILILLGLPFGILRVWRRYRGDSLALALGVGAIAYPASLGLRLTHFGAEASNRTSEFLFVPIAFVLAVAASELWLNRPKSWVRPVLFASWAAVIFAGGIIVGMPRWGRMPGPYLVAADTRSIEPKGVAAAEWMRTEVGPGNRVAMDRINGLLMGSYGGQTNVRYSYEGTGLAWVFFPTTFGPTEIALLQSGRVHYVVVDHRLTAQLPVVGIYYEMGEPDTYGHIVPMDPAAFAKFDGVPGIQRVYDSGDIVIYDVGALTNAP
jgi:hypothetical protein